MIFCVVVVLLGFTAAALCEIFFIPEKRWDEFAQGRLTSIGGDWRSLSITICVVILVADGFENSSDDGYISSNPDRAIMKYLQEDRAVTGLGKR